MTWPADTLTCGRCGAEGRNPAIRDTIANLEREHREDGVLHKQPQYEIHPRCRDREACRERVRRAQGGAA